MESIQSIPWSAWKEAAGMFTYLMLAIFWNELRLAVFRREPPATR